MIQPRRGRHCNVSGLKFRRPWSATSPFLVGSGATRPSRRCPACAEDILLEAIVCRFCGHSLSAEEVARAVQDRDRQIQAAAAAAQQAELARQQQRHIKRLRGRRTRRLVFGGILTWVGGWMLITMTAMFFSSPAAGNTADQQRIAAATVGFLFGLVPLAGGIAPAVGGEVGQTVADCRAD